MIQSRSEGAGVGFGIKDFAVPKTERGKGKGRIMHFFNPSLEVRNEVVEVIIWDWPADYWGHTYISILVDVTVPPYGYTTYTLTEREETNQKYVQESGGPRVNKHIEYILENEFIKATFDTCKAVITSLTDKETDSEIVCRTSPAGIFRLIKEDDSRGMTSWVVGRYMKIINLHEEENVRIISCNIDTNTLRQWISYTIEFGESKLKVVVSLDKFSSRLNYKVECDWQEKPVRGKYVPQLNFYIPLSYKCKAYKYDIPLELYKELKWMTMFLQTAGMAGIPEQGRNTVMLVTDTKYGFRGYEDSLTVDLIRSSYDPDPYPEIGVHKFGFAIDIKRNPKGQKFDENNTVHNETINKKLIQSAYDYNHPISYISGTAHTGSEPVEKSFITVESGNIAISAVKMPEIRRDSDSREIIIRVYETEGTDTKAVIKFAKNIRKAYFVDINEIADKSRPVKFNGNELIFDVSAHKMESLGVAFPMDTHK